MVGIFLDLCKAFDSVSHTEFLVIIKTKKLKIEGQSINMFTSYLHESKQFVEVSNMNNKGKRDYFSSKKFTEMF